MSKKALLWIGVLAIAGFALYKTFAGTYNSLVQLDEGVTSSWAQVQNQYQRRADLIPNLVNTVKGYAAHEKETLEAVVQARANATQAKIDAGALVSDPQALQRFQAAQNQLTGALSRLLLVVERYPDLKANETFINLQTQLEGTENRIATERRRFNEQVQGYNQHLRRFPTVMLAGLFGFQQKAYFEAAPDAQQAPVVDFND